MGKRARITSDRLNSYGTRVLTEGMDLEQYLRNPVLLYMHERGRVIGYMKDVETDGREVTGEPVFDCATALSLQCKKQWEAGSLRMVSAGLDILETSEDPSLLVPGQTSPTVTRSKLYEVSIVDIGANDDALVLRREGRQITLGRDSECPLPLLNDKPINNKPTNQTSTDMELKAIALQLGLPETATEAEVTARIGELSAAKQESETLKQEKEALELAAIEEAVDAAVRDRRIGAEKKDHFISLGKSVGIESLRETLGAIGPQIRLSQVIGHADQTAPTGQATYTKLSEVPSDRLRKMRSEDPEQYKRLYKAEYGMECRLEED